MPPPPPAKKARVDRDDRRRDEDRGPVAGDRRRAIEDRRSDRDDRRRAPAQHVDWKNADEWKCSEEELEEWMNVGYSDLAARWASTLNELSVDSSAQKELFLLSQTSPQFHMASCEIMEKLLRNSRDGKVNNPSAFLHSCVRNVTEGRSWSRD